MKFSQQSSLTTDLDLTAYLEPGCETLEIYSPAKNEGCFTVPGGPDGGWLLENKQFGATYVTNNDHPTRPGYEDPSSEYGWCNIETQWPY